MYSGCEFGSGIEVGGVIYTEGAQKAARFIMDCNQNSYHCSSSMTPNGFMVGKGGVVGNCLRWGKNGRRLAPAPPKIRSHHRRQLRCGHYAMCGKAYDPGDLVCVADSPLRRDERSGGSRRTAEVRASRWSGRKSSLEAEKKDLYDEIKGTYDAQADPRYGAARLWIDSIIDPAKTRGLDHGAEARALNTGIPKFNPGVLRPEFGVRSSNSRDSRAGTRI